MLITVVFLSSSRIAQANVKKYITNKNFIGTYYMKGKYKKVTESHGAYNVTVGEITKNGNLTLHVEYAGRNGSPVYGTNVIHTKIKGNKAYFNWHDSWGNRGKGKIKFVKKHRFSLTMTNTKRAKQNRASLDVKNAKFIYYSKWHDLSEIHDF